MRKYLFISAVCILSLLASCSDDGYATDGILPDTNAAKTVFMYMPWTGNSYNLYDNFQQNIKDVESAITEQNGLGDKSLMIFISQSATRGALIKVKFENGKCVHDTIRTYQNTAANNLVLNTSHWITYIMNQVKSYAPADTFAMVFSGHGNGWLNATTASAKATRYFSSSEGERLTRSTRWIGGLDVMTDISIIAEGLSASNVGKLQYLLFDDCYMSNMETAYCLRNNANYIIACPTEIMAYGMPYARLWKYLIGDNPDYQGICDEFYDFYNNYEISGTPYHYGTIGITNCAQTDSMATLMKKINTAYTFDTSLTSSLQVLDGYEPPVFYDLGSYTRLLCTGDSLLNLFEGQLTRLVPYKAHTDSYYSSMTNSGAHSITTFSGITVSDPSTNATETVGKENTAWYTATH